MGIFLSINKLPTNIPQADKSNPKAAQALQEAPRRTIWRNENHDANLFQNMNFRGDQRHTKICSEV
jgi:manganese catalase